MTRYAACACGQLTVACEGEPIRLSMCHCLDCQRRTGSVFGVQARFPIAAVAIEGDSTEYVRVADSGNRGILHFCPSCGSTVYWRPEGVPQFVAVAVGAFADPNFPAPKFSVYEARRHHWVMVPENVEHMD